MEGLAEGVAGTEEQGLSPRVLKSWQEGGRAGLWSRWHPTAYTEPGSADGEAPSCSEWTCRSFSLWSISLYHASMTLAYFKIQRKAVP